MRLIARLDTAAAWVSVQWVTVCCGQLTLQEDVAPELQLLTRNYYRRDRGNTPYSPHLEVVVFLLQEPAKLP